MLRKTLIAAAVLLCASHMGNASASLYKYQECVKWCQLEVEKQAGIKNSLGMAVYDRNKTDQEKIIPFMSVLSACVDGCENFAK